MSFECQANSAKEIIEIAEYAISRGKSLEREARALAVSIGTLKAIDELDINSFAVDINNSRFSVDRKLLVDMLRRAVNKELARLKADAQSVPIVEGGTDVILR